MNNPLKCSFVFMASAALACAGQVFSAQPPELQPALTKLASAKPGETVKLPAGTFKIDEIVVPSGVILTGAGYNKTILVANAPYGLTVTSGTGTQISDLSVRGAKGAGIEVEKSSDITLSRIGIEQALTGLMVIDSSKVRVENLILAENRTGAVFNGNTDSSLVNSTFTDNTALAISLGVNTNSAVFNNLFLNSPLGVFVAPTNDSLLLDYNIYQVSKIGKSGDTPPESVFSWRDQTGYDAHSLQQAVEFGKAADFVYKADNVMAWSPDRVVTSSWGTPALGAFAAPKLDIEGQAYVDGPCVGAWEVKIAAPRPADGKFTITGDEGTSSAGIYAKDGRLLTWLFNMLPLKKGVHSFWVPPRDLYGQPIAAGDYELRTAQANLRFVAVGNGFGGNTGPGPKIDTLAQIGNSQGIFDENGQVIIGLGWNEGGINARSMAPDFKSQNWSLPGTADHIGIATDGKGFVYSLRKADANYVLLRLDEKTGLTTEFAPGEFNHLIPTAQFSKEVGGLAVLGDALFLTDKGSNKVFMAPTSKPDFTVGVDMPSPSSPSADSKRGLVWMLSGDNIVALDPKGAKKIEIASPVAHATSLSVRGDTLALLAPDTGNVQFFTLNDLAKLTPKGQVAGAAETMPPRPLSRLALNDAGDVLVLNSGGFALFGSDGTKKSDFLGGWYNSFQVGQMQPDGTIAVFDSAMDDMRVLYDSKNKTWKFNGRYTGKQGQVLDMFNRDGKTYLLTRGTTGKSAEGVTPPVAGIAFYCVSRVDGEKVVPLVAWALPGSQLVTTTDFSKPLAEIFNAARWQPVMGSDGKPLSLPGVSLHAAANGDFLIDGGLKVGVLPLTGFDAKGVPQYNWLTPMRNLVAAGLTGDFHSPHTFEVVSATTKPMGTPPNRTLSFYSDGGTPRGVSVVGGRLAGLTGNWGATDLASFDKDGKMEWFQPLPQVNSMTGPYVVKDIIYGNGIISSETQVFARDGLYLGRLGQPKGIPWGGKWLDNGLQFRPFAGLDGKQYVLYGDFNECCMFWFEVAGLDQVIYQKQPFVISPGLATALAALPQPGVPKQPQPPTTKIVIKKLDAPMPINGEMEKWRKVVPVPQVIITPDTGSPAISGPADCSALLRFAYEGNNLYVQVIKFDDIITQFQDAANYYRQDSTEMAINSFSSGFKFNISHTRDKGDMIMRDRFFFTKLTKFLDPTKAPRKITVLDNAESVSERKLIEALYNVDLSKSKVIVTEFKLPLDADTYEGAEKDAPTTKSGDTMRIGVMIDDNDFPGGDVQEFEVWPAPYNTFSGPETGALATFE